MRSPLQLRPLRAALGLAVVAFVYRAYLTTIYWGHEEEDWGNLQLIRGIMDNPLGQVESEHMPLFTWLAAVVSSVIGDPQLGAECIAVLAGAGTVAVTTWIGMRWFHPGVGLLAGLLLCFQPEAALYSATPLREALFTLTTMGGIALIGSRRTIAGALLLSLAFLTRFNIAFSILPALALWAFRPSAKQEDRRSLHLALGVLGTTVAVWAIYYHSQQGTWGFWTGVLERNTGSAVTDLFLEERIRATLEATFGLTFLVLPGHVGWLVVPLAVLGAIQLRALPLRDAQAASWLTLCAASTLALLLLTALVSTYEWRHNLYWKWLTPTVPFFCLLGAHGGHRLSVWLSEHPWFHRSGVPRLSRRRVQELGAIVFVVISLTGFAKETAAQLEDSNRIYGTQVRVAQWFEEEWTEGSRVLTWAYSIPAAYLQRKHNSVTVMHWQNPGVPHQDPEAFGTWIFDQRIGLILWYSEESGGAKRAAPYLATGRSMQLGPVRIEPLVDERKYGMIAFRVVTESLPTPRDIPTQAWFEGRSR